MKRLNKKGFTLVELLAVIIILAIVVGLTIPAVLTVTTNTKKKAFDTAAQEMANWFDRQYQVAITGLGSDGIATLDANFGTTCGSDGANCTAGMVGIPNALVVAAGVRTDNVVPSTGANGEDLGTVSTVYINSATGRSCVKLIASTGGDYPDGKTECGGVCEESMCKSDVDE